MSASKSLPPRPSLESLRKQAKKLARDRAIFDLLQPDGPLTVEGAGADIWGSSDSFEFAAQYPSAKSLRVVSRVLSLDAANSFAKAGLMFSDPHRIPRRCSCSRSSER
jgi:hypothetical protein